MTRNPFTFRRWRTTSGWLVQMLMVMYGSVWQIVTSPPDRVVVSVANLIGAAVAFLALHIADGRRSEAVERWAYPPLVFTMSCYLALALRFEGWMGLVVQPNFGVLLSAAVVITATTRFVYLVTHRRVEKAVRRRRVRREANKLINGDPMSG